MGNLNSNRCLNIWQYLQRCHLLSEYCHGGKILLILFYSICYGIVTRKGSSVLSENEMELIRIIRENDNPEQALMAAATIIFGYLKQHGSSEEQAAADLPALG